MAFKFLNYEINRENAKNFNRNKFCLRYNTLYEFGLVYVPKRCFCYIVGWLFESNLRREKPKHTSLIHTLKLSKCFFYCFIQHQASFLIEQTVSFVYH